MVRLRGESQLWSVPVVGEYEVTAGDVHPRPHQSRTRLELMHFALAPRPSELSFMAWGKVIHRIGLRHVFAQRSGWGASYLSVRSYTCCRSSITQVSKHELEGLVTPIYISSQKKFHRQHIAYSPFQSSQSQPIYCRLQNRASSSRDASHSATWDLVKHLLS